MQASEVKRENVQQAVEVALARCKQALSDERTQDLLVAVDALTLIQHELQGGSKRLKGQRSAAFTRYMIDEGDSSTINADLRDLIVRIEAVWNRT